MATAAEQTQIIELIVGMVGGAAPGADILAELEAIFDSGVSLVELADALVANPAYDAIYDPELTDAEFTEAFIGDLIGDEVSAEVLADTEEAFLALLTAGDTRGAAMSGTITALSAIDTDDADLGDAAQALANKVEVATYYSVELGFSSDSLDTLLSVTAGVTSAAATVTSAQAAADDLDPEILALVEAAVNAAFAELTIDDDATAGEVATAAALTLTSAEAAIAGGGTQAAIDAGLAVLVAANATTTLTANIKALAAANLAVADFLETADDGDETTSAAVDAAATAAFVAYNVEVPDALAADSDELIASKFTTASIEATEAVTAATKALGTANTNAAAIATLVADDVAAKAEVVALNKISDNAAASGTAFIAFNGALGAFNANSGLTVPPAQTADGAQAGLITVTDGDLSIISPNGNADLTFVKDMDGVTAVTAVAQEGTITLAGTETDTTNEVLTTTITDAGGTATFTITVQADDAFDDAATAVSAVTYDVTGTSSQTYTVTEAAGVVTIVADTAGTAFTAATVSTTPGATEDITAGALVTTVANVATVVAVKETSTVTFDALEIGDSLVIDGIGFTAATALTATAAASAFEDAHTAAVANGAVTVYTATDNTDGTVTFVQTLAGKPLADLAGGAITETTNPGITALVAATQVLEDAQAETIAAEATAATAAAALLAADPTLSLSTAVETAVENLEDAEDALEDLNDAKDDLDDANATKDALDDLEEAAADAADELENLQILDGAITATDEDDVLLAEDSDAVVADFLEEGDDVIYFGDTYTVNAGDPDEDGDDTVLEIFITDKSAIDDTAVITVETEVFGSSSTGDFFTIELTGLTIEDITVEDGFIVAV